METPNFSHEQKENKEKKIVDRLVKIDEEIKQFGGSQKYVLLESAEGYSFGTLPYSSHPEIAQQMKENLNGELENRGGGFLKFFSGEVKIGDESSLNLGPLQVRKQELINLLEGKIDDYKIDLSE